MPQKEGEGSGVSCAEDAELHRILGPQCTPERGEAERKAMGSSSKRVLLGKGALRFRGAFAPEAVLSGPRTDDPVAEKGFGSR